MKILQTTILAILFVFLASACGSRNKSIESTLVVTKVAKTNYEKVSDSERFGVKVNLPPVLPNQSSIAFEYQLPSHWSDTERRDQRDVNIKIENATDTDCYLTILPVRAGDILMNLNRWRGQFNLNPIKDLIEQKNEPITFLNIQTLIFEIEGKYQTKEDYKMYGIITNDNSNAYSIKFIGPAKTIDSEKQNFINWLKSVKMKASNEESKTVPSKTNSKLSWQTPENWRLEPEKPQRIATFKPNNKEKTECTISIFKGSLIDNLNRWRKQMGQKEISDINQDKIEKITTSLGECFITKIEGNFNGGMNSAAIDDAILIGGILPRGDSSIFIKMIGPKLEAENEFESFKALILTLKENNE